MRTLALSLYFLVALSRLSAATNPVLAQSPLAIPQINRAQGSCVDYLADNECGRKSHLCNIRAYDRLMKEKCPKTCGYCKPSNPNPVDPPSGNCVDTLPECSAKKHLCKDPRYNRLTNKYCPVTCNRCKPEPVKNECVNKDDAACIRNIERCFDPFFEASMRQNCREACGFC